VGRRPAKPRSAPNIGLWLGLLAVTKSPLDSEVVDLLPVRALLRRRLDLRQALVDRGQKLNLHSIGLRSTQLTISRERRLRERHQYSDRVPESIVDSRLAPRLACSSLGDVNRVDDRARASRQPLDNRDR